MLNLPIQEIDRRLRQLARVVGSTPGLPNELVQEFELVCLRLTAYVVELDFQMLRLAEAWTWLERQ